MDPFSSGDLEDAMGSCTFQFWVDRIESFYCKLDDCKWNFADSPGTLSRVDPSRLDRALTPPDANGTKYTCEKLDCYCVPDRFLCGEDGSVSE